MKLSSLLPYLNIQTALNSEPSYANQDAILAFSETWQILGPFQIGTREATWGADPLEFYGGFPSLSYDQTATYSSSLTPNATVTWGYTIATSVTSGPNLSKAVLNVAFPEIDLAFLQSIYGWAALQYQAWARGTLLVNGDAEQTITFYTERLLEFYVDGENHFGGDYYGFEKVPLVLHLKPGEHTIDLRLVRDVRSMGGIGKPTVDVTITAEISTGELDLAPHPAILPDMVDGKLAGALGSVTVRNDGQEDVFVSGVSINDTAYFAWLAQPSDLRVASGQTRPVAFVISCISDCSPDIRIDVEYGNSSISLPCTIKQKAIHEPHKRTFLHPGGMVSYAILRPPTTKIACSTGPENKLPVLLQLHGAGLEADSALVRHALDPVPDLCAWVLFPTGSTAWSGDDWHIWGFADVEAAIDSLPVWLELVDWKGPGVDTDRWLVSGHSNGGQGTWYTLLHRPDKIIAAAPVSGYSSIQNYVPYHFWRPIDPSVRSLLDTSLSSYRHERLLTNAQQIPIFQQHGSVDDNVPVFHSRLMSQLVHQAGANSTYVELKGENHWFDGIMTTEPLKDFYEQHLNGVRSSVNPPRNFSFAVANPADMGTKHGISVLHLLRTGRLGRVEVSFAISEPTCFIKTSNILSLRLPAVYPRTHELVIDGKAIHLSPLSDSLDLWRYPDGHWKVTTPRTSPALRQGKQLGSMDAVLHTQSTLQIVRSSRAPAVDKIALQISRNVCQYFGADTEIVDRPTSYTPQYSNVIRVAIGQDVPDSHISDFPVRVDDHIPSMVTVRGADGLRRYSSDAGLGAIFLRSLGNEQVELVVWGADEEGLKIAARLVPMLTGVGQPDFVVADRKMLWGGAGEVLAMGYFDHLWNVTGESYLT